MPRSAAHPFYARLNQILDKHDFDGFVEGLCERFYAEEGRPGLPPGRYFRLLLIGYFEGLDAERVIAWRAADSFALREFLGLILPEAPPARSSRSPCRTPTTATQRQASTLITAAEQIEAVLPEGDGLQEVVGDKGYHSNQSLVDLEAVGVRSYISEPDRGRRNRSKQPAARAAVYRNRRRIRGPRGLRLLRLRGERLEPPCAHLYETSGMPRVHLRVHTNILKRLLIHTGGFNLGLLMPQLIGAGTPRGLQGRLSAVVAALLIGSLSHLATGHGWSVRQVLPPKDHSIARFGIVHIGAREMVFTMGGLLGACANDHSHSRETLSARAAQARARARSNVRIQSCMNRAPITPS